MKLKPGDKIIYKDRACGSILRPAGSDMLKDFGFLKGRRKSPALEKIRKAVRKKIADQIRKI
jgi:bifunctional DNA-binding transcriptional regulator/antitoxin component of YhaV-PrlF toxin-antitoxin module